MFKNKVKRKDIVHKVATLFTGTNVMFNFSWKVIFIDIPRGDKGARDLPAFKF